MNPAPDLVLCSDEGLAVRIGGGPILSLPWHEVHRVHAHRLAAGHAQPVILGVEDDGGNVVEIPETAEGWTELVARIAQLAGSPAARMVERIADLRVDGSTEMLFSLKGE